jgi:hypothetical protein
MRIDLPPILTLARTGATQRAWDAFIAAGLDGVDDIKALTLKGRLLKDRARQAAGAERRALFAQSGAAYAQAATLRPDSYPLINAAAMALFAGDGAAAGTIARDVLTLIDADPSQGETPYWREATRAEALLLLDRLPDAQASLAAAMRLAPEAWEDHAATLRQFAMILAATGGDTDWLNPLRPAPSLHYSGILGIAPDDRSAHDAIHAAIAKIAPGFGYGALAAGADIIAAEAILAAGAELHVVLPAASDRFCNSSVAPYGPEWTARYHRLLEAATSLTIMGDSDAVSRAGIALADYQAMGMAAHNAALLESRAMALRIEPDDRPALGDPWLHSGRPMVHVAVTESAPTPRDIALQEGAMTFPLASGDGRPVQSFTTLTNAVAAAAQSENGAALDCRLDDDSHGVAALLRQATAGGLMASQAAAMAMMATGLATAIEPLGELEMAGGSTGVYAVRLASP